MLLAPKGFGSPFHPRARIARRARPARALTALLLGVALATAAVPTPALAAGGFGKVATNLAAAAQPTAMGKTIATLKAWNGKLYSGYGDYGANTGPIALTPLSGSALSATPEAVADTEAVWIFRELGGKLYAPSIDPRVGSDFAVGRSSSGLPDWLNLTLVRATHVFDMVSLDGTDLWLVGSQGNDAVAWRSVDGGSTWSEMLRVPPINGTAGGDFARFYGAGVRDGKLYVQAEDYPAGLQPQSKVYDGTGWSDGPSLGTVFNHAEGFGGRLLFHGAYHAAHFTGPLMAFDGTRSTSVYSQIYDYTISGGTVYVLGTDRKVKASKDLVRWTQVGSAPATARSIGVMNGVVYLGGTDSAIYRQK